MSADVLLLAFAAYLPGVSWFLLWCFDIRRSRRPSSASLAVLLPIASSRCLFCAFCYYLAWRCKSVRTGRLLRQRRYSQEVKIENFGLLRRASVSFTLEASFCEVFFKSCLPRTLCLEEEFSANWDDAPLSTKLFFGHLILGLLLLRIFFCILSAKTRSTNEQRNDQVRDYFCFPNFLYQRTVLRSEVFLGLAPSVGLLDYHWKI